MTAPFTQLLIAAATRSQAHLDRPWSWPDREGEELDGRYVYFALLRLEQGAVAASAPAETEAARLVDVAQAAFGDLRGLLAGIREEDLERSPGEGQWSLREVYGHVLGVERRYAEQISYALSRSDEDPVYIRPASDSAAPPEDTLGGPADLIRRLADARRLSLPFRELTAAELVRPTRWAGHDVDVRFRLKRFAEHLIEHTIHCQKQLAALGVAPTEAGELVRRLSLLRGQHELRTSPSELDRLDAEEEALLRTLA